MWLKITDVYCAKKRDPRLDINAVVVKWIEQLYEQE
jgi:hypothetical protein